MQYEKTIRKQDLKEIETKREKEKKITETSCGRCRRTFKFGGCNTQLHVYGQHQQHVTSWLRVLTCAWTRLASGLPKEKGKKRNTNGCSTRVSEQALSSLFPRKTCLENTLANRKCTSTAFHVRRTQPKNSPVLRSSNKIVPHYAKKRKLPDVRSLIH